MPAYAFEIRWDSGEKTSWTYLPSDDSANKFARLLAQNFKSGGQYRGVTYMAVRNSEGAVVGSIEF